MGSVTAIIKAGGKVLPAKYQVMYIDVTKELNRIPAAELAIIDGNPSKQKFELSEEKMLEPGSTLEISLRYEDVEGKSLPNTKPQLVFSGLVTKQGVSSRPQGSFLVVEARDSAVRMTAARKNMVFKGKTDDKIISEILKPYAIKGTIPAIPGDQSEMVQYYTSDWDFVLNRADVNGLLSFADDGTLTMFEYKKKPKALKHEFEWGTDNIFDFEMEVDGTGQVGTVKPYAWDIKTAKLNNKVKVLKPPPKVIGNIAPKAVAAKVGDKKAELFSGVQLSPEEMGGWAKAQMLKNELSLYRGRIKVLGDGTIKPGDTLTIKGIGKRFNGVTMITGIRHRAGTDGWRTDIQFGLAADWFSHKEGVMEQPAAGLLPGFTGLQIGIVEAWEKDKKNFDRCKVVVPALNNPKGFVWARMSMADAGKERGLFFWPEKGDEVVLGFFNDDPRQAVILGSLYNGVGKPPMPPDAKNNFKGIVTREKLKLLFNDEEKSVLIQTTETNSILISEKEKVITVIDGMNENEITLSKKGIEIISGKDLTITVKGNLKIDCKGNIEIKGAKTDII